MSTATDLEILPSQDEWTRLKEIGAAALKSGLLPAAIKSPEAATIIALKGYELGLKPMVAFSHIHVVNGKPGCSAELMLASIKQAYPKTTIKFRQMNEKACVIDVKEDGEQDFESFSFTIEEAQKAGLTGKDVWKNYATDMLRARAITRMKRSKFPQILMGLDHTPEELGAEINEKGDVKPPPAAAAQAPAPQPQSIRAQVAHTEDPVIEAEVLDRPNTEAAMRTSVASEINKEKKRLGMSALAVADIGQRLYKKGPAELSLEEMGGVLKELQSLKAKESP